MKITKLGHSCLLVEMPAPVNRTALFDPGYMSAVDIASLKFLDDIVITHAHGDHLDSTAIKQLQEKFPEVRIIASAKANETLREAGIESSITMPDGMELFDAPHEPVAPVFAETDNIGVHYLDRLTIPGDCTHFAESKTILALPVAAPWGSSVQAVNLALELKPKHVIPIHDWHWSDDAKKSMYDRMAEVFEAAGITFHKAVDGEPIVIDI